MIIINAEISKESLLNKRANELAINLIIKNAGNNLIKVRNITSMLPDHVNAALQIDKQQKSRLELANDIYKQLEVLVNFNALNLQNSKELWIKNATSFFKELIKNFHNLFFKVYLAPAAFNAIIHKYSYRLQSLEVDIKNLSDAQWAFDNYIKPTEDKNLITLYESKLRQLNDMKLENNESEIIAEIGSNETFTRTYVFKFRRSYWEERLYSLNFDVGFLEKENTLDQTKDASCSFSVAISPKPLFLTVLAAIFSLLGVILKISVATSEPKTPSEPITPLDFFSKISIALQTQAGIGAIILAIVFFNIYENTELGKKISVNVDWRAAMLIGIISGMFGDRIIDAFKVIVGVN